MTARAPEARGERRQQHDLEFECFLDAGTPRKSEHPLLVDDRDLEVVSVVDLSNRPGAAPERVCNEPPSLQVTRQ
jgi:hypothetical protein